MDVVGHQRVSPDANAVLVTSILENPKVDEAIRFVMKDGIPANTTVMNVVCILGNNAPTRSGHMK
jgi:hypothetical protein